MLLKRRFEDLNEIKDEDFNTTLSNISGHVNLEMMTKLFYRFLVYDGEVNLAHEDSLKEEKNQVSIPSSNKENERKKLTKLLENGYFHDIVVNVREKTYKLHKFMLNPASGYFAEISSTKQSNADAQCTEAPTQRQQPKINEYVLRDIDQTTFDMIIKDIYFGDEVSLTSETIIRVIRAANILRMEKLFDRCLYWMRNNIEKICTQVFNIDGRFPTSWIGDNIKEISSKVLIESEISNTSPICLFSFDFLEDLLFSSSHCCDNPHKIVDVCSKWVMHDVKNRFHMVPQLALAINHNRNHYDMDASTDLNNCTEKSIRDELWKILRLTVLVPSATKISENCEKKHETPVFVALTREKSTIHVLNANLEQITSLYLSNDTRLDCVTATLIDDNLFIASSTGFERLAFHVVNLSLKKIVCLNRCIRVKMEKNVCICSRVWLLNCCGQVYYCCGHHVLKYSAELNRWMVLFSDESMVYNGTKWFTSDGKKLYRLYAESSTCVVHEFNFHQNVWSSLSDLSFTWSFVDDVIDFSILDDGQFTVLSGSKFMSFDQKSRKWRQFSMTKEFIYADFKKCYVLTQCEGRLIHVFGNKLYHWSQRNRTWQLKKELPSRFESVSSECSKTKNPGPYRCISAVH